MFPKMIPFSVEETLTLALIEQKSNGPMTTGDGRSTNFKSPKVANSKVTFCNVSLVWFTIKTSRTMSYWWTWTYASAYTGSLNPVSWVTLLNLEELKKNFNFFSWNWYIKLQNYNFSWKWKFTWNQQHFLSLMFQELDSVPIQKCLQLQLNH